MVEPNAQDATARASDSPEDQHELGTVDQTEARTQETAAATRGFVRAESGAPIAGALLTLTPLEADWLAAATTWPDLEWTSVDAASVSTTSAADGSYAFARTPTSDQADRTILWVTHPDFVAQWFELECVDGVLGLPSRIDLATAAPLVARVLDAAGKPVAGATVVQRPDLLAEDLGEERSDDTEAKLVFRRATATDSNGRAVLSPIRGKQWVHAEADGLRSGSWRGKHPADITLRLAATFTVGGSILPGEGVHLDEALTVRCSARIGGELFELDQIKTVGARWGPMSLPALEVQGFVFQLCGGSIAQDEVALEPQRAGAHATVDFRPAVGLQVRVRVIDEESHAIEGATVSVHWSIGERYTKVERRTGADGLARFDNFRAGNLWIRARCPGFRPVLFEGPAITAPPPEPIVLTLKKAGRVSGRCTHRGEPISNFTILFWQGHANNAVSSPFHGSSDGRFVIEEVPLGEVILLAMSEDHPSPPSTKIVVTDDGAAVVDFEFPDALVGRGIVVDGMTGKPIPGASIQLQCQHRDERFGNYNMRAWGAPQFTDADGKFEMLGLQAGYNGLEVRAAGYAKGGASFLGRDRTSFDLDPIPLFAKQSARLRLTSREPQDFRAFRADMDGPAYFEMRNFSEDGRLVFDGVDPGSYAIRIAYPGSTTITTWAIVKPGSGLDLEIPVSGRRCTVEIATEDGTRLPAGAWLRTDFPTGDSGYLVHYYFIPDDQRVELLSVLPVPTVLQVDTAEQVVLGVQRVDFSKIADGATVSFRIPSTARTFRVVDAAQDPVPSAKVVVSSPGEPGGWCHHLVTDANGECTLRGAGLGLVRVFVFEPFLGVMPSREIDLRDADSKPIELILDPQRVLKVRLMERSVPAVGVAVLARDVAWMSWGLPIAYSAADGLVQWTHVAAGDFQTVVQQPGYWPTEASVRLTGDDPPPVVQVRRLGSIDIQVENAYGNPAAGVALDMFSNEMQTWVSDWVDQRRIPAPTGGLTTGASGSVRLSGLPNGEYRWRARTAAGDTLEGLVVVPPSGAATLTIKVP